MSIEQRLLQITAFSFFLISCGTTDNKDIDILHNIYHDEYNTVILKPEFANKSILLNPVSTISSILFLDSTQIVGEISKMILEKDHLYIMDKKSKTFFCFDTTGKLAWKYHKVGIGPSDYAELSDFAVRNNNIFLFANTRGKIIQLDSNGNYKKHISTVNRSRKFYPDFLFVDTKGKFVLCNEDMGDYKNLPWIMAVEDSTYQKFESFHILKSNNPAVKRWAAESIPMKPFHNNLGFYFTTVFNDTIYSFENGTFSRKYVLDFKEYTPPESMRKDQDLTLQKFFQTKYAGNIQALYDTDSLLTLTYLRGGKPNFVFIRKADNKIKQFNLMMMSFGPLWQQVQFIGNGGNKLAFLIEPANILAANKAFRETQKDAAEYGRALEKQYPIFKRLLNSVSINSNAILVLVDLNTKKIFNDPEL